MLLKNENFLICSGILLTEKGAVICEGLIPIFKQASESALIIRPISLDKLEIAITPVERTTKSMS